VLDNLYIRSPGSLYDAFRPAEARRLAEKLEIPHTPKHGSWLNIVRSLTNEEVPVTLLAQELSPPG
jgi:hypothetical protein